MGTLLILADARPAYLHAPGAVSSLLLTPLGSCTLLRQLADELGGAEAVTIAFAHCPFRELAEADPQVVCAAHCGMVTGFVDELAVHSVTRFHSIVDRSPCQVELARAASAADTL